MLTVHGKRIRFSECDLAETEYLRGIIEALRRECPTAVADADFMFLNGFEPDDRCRTLGDENTIVFIFDEFRTLYPDVVQRVRAAFQTHIDDRDRIARNHHTFPLGHAFAFNPGYPSPINERRYDVCFSGNLHRGRTDFYRWLSRLPLPFPILARLQRLTGRKFDRRFGTSSYIRFTSTFASGLSHQEYAQLLADSKIVLCPGGSVSVENFRLYEAMMAGCVVISERLPERAWFAGAPVIEINRWADAGPIIKDLLADPARLAALSRQTLDWHADHLSPEALARRMCALLEADRPQSSESAA